MLLHQTLTQLLPASRNFREIIIIIVGILFVRLAQSCLIKTIRIEWNGMGRKGTDWTATSSWKLWNWHINVYYFMFISWQWSRMGRKKDIHINLPSLCSTASCVALLIFARQFHFFYSAPACHARHNFLFLYVVYTAHSNFNTVIFIVEWHFSVCIFMSVYVLRLSYIIIILYASSLKTESWTMRQRELRSECQRMDRITMLTIIRSNLIT